MSEGKNIFIKGARVNNLKNIDVEIPRNKFIVITGLSGSGKSSLAFDTLYAEGQRRYVESLSSYARQFLGRMNKPETDYIRGIPPDIAISQRVSSRNPRSTVGTSTEIYEYLRLLFARVGKTISPVSGQVVKKHQVSDIVEKMLSYPEDTRLAILTKIVLRDDRSLNQQLEILSKEGFSRVEIDGQFDRIDEVVAAKEKKEPDDLLLLIDRLTCDKDAANISRFSESIETAFFEGEGDCIVRFYIGDKIES
ncbi:MAG: excinuclease ABC subunit A, partial [Prevotella sp.]|nr:excinuclease ABC subunit A [Prevotella sp.]